MKIWEQRPGRCKGPEVHMSLTYLRNTEMPKGGSLVSQEGWQGKKQGQGTDHRMPQGQR